MLLLTLLRHARTESARDGQEDWHRELEPRGQRDAPEMARRLRDRGLTPKLIIASPAVRAIATATLVARELGLPKDKIVEDERLYLASPNAMLQVIKERGGSASPLMIVGHNPGISELADKLSAERSLDNMPTCGAYTLEFDLRDWSEIETATGFNAQFDYPGQI